MPQLVLFACNRRGMRRQPVTMLLVAALSVGAAACDHPNASWVDPDAHVTSSPSPLAFPQVVPFDSTLPDGAPQAEFLLVQDLLREAGAVTLLARTLADMSESRTEMPHVGMAPSPPMPTSSELGDGDAPRDSARCARSLRIALAPARGRVAVWWTRRDAGRVRLIAAWRDTIPSTGRLAPWRGPIVIDSTDQGPDAAADEYTAVACARPAPSVVVDDSQGYVHVAYVLKGQEGAGVFYAHQMDPRAGFEPPLAIVYGARLGAARVAASGPLVAVAYEDPNSGARPRIGLAISTLSGHRFETPLTASGSNSVAHDPYVAVRGRAIVVGWSETPVSGGAPRFMTRRAKVR